jgi:lambda family phage tail tape measure protein
LPVQINRSIRLSVEGGEEAADSFRKVGTEAESSLAKIGPAASNSARQFAQAANQNEQSANRMRFAFGNVANQFQDVIVQVQSGTNAFTILAQQGPQIASAFGPIGAIVGVAVAGISALAGAFFRVNETSSKTKDVLDSAVTAFGSGATAAKQFADALDATDAAGRRALETLARLETTQLQTRSNALVGQLTTGVVPTIRSQVAQPPGTFGTVGERLAQLSGEEQEVIRRARGFSETLTRAVQTNDIDALARIFSDPAVSRDADLAGLGVELISNAERGRALELLSRGDTAGLRTLAGPTAASRSAGHSAAHNEATEAAHDIDVIQELQRQLLSLQDARAGAAETAGARLSGIATPEQRQQVEDLSHSITDLKKAQEEAKKSESELQALQKEGAKLTREYSTPLQKLATDQERLGILLDKNAISQQTFDRAMEEARKRTEEAQLAAGKDPITGIRRSLHDFLLEADDLSKVTAEATTRVLGGLEDAFIQFATTGKVTFATFAASAIADLERVAFRAAVLAPIARALDSAFSGGFGSLFGSGAGGGAGGTGGFFVSPSGFHTGGIVGDIQNTRRVDPRLFLRAQRYHSGGLVGDEVPIIARRGEVVSTPAQWAAQGRTNVVVNNYAGVGVSTRSRTDANGGQQLEVMLYQQSARQVRTGSQDGAMNARYGLRPVPLSR